MEGVVDHRALLGERHVVADHGHQVHAAVLGGKADDGGGAAERGGRGGALEGVGVDDAGGGELLDVGVRVDAAGQHQLALGVDLGGAGGEIAADGGDDAVLDADVGVELIDGRPDAACRGSRNRMRLVASGTSSWLAFGFALDGDARGSQQWRQIEEDASMASRPRRRILVVNPNSNEVVTKGLADALAPVAFEDGPEIDCVTLKEGPYGIETQEHVESVTLPLRRLVAGSNEVDAFVIACYSDPGLHVCREATSRPVFGINECGRADGAGAGRALRRHRHRPALDPPAHALHAPDGAASTASPASGRWT